MTEQEPSILDVDRAKCVEAYNAWVSKPKSVRETPGSDHAREIEWIAFREGWAAAIEAMRTGPTGVEK